MAVREDALGLDPVRTGAWIMPDDRPLPAGLSLIDEKDDCTTIRTDGASVAATTLINLIDQVRG